MYKCYPIVLSAKMEVFYVCAVEYGICQSHVAIKPLKSGFYDWGTKFLILTTLFKI